MQSETSITSKELLTNIYSHLYHISGLVNRLELLGVDIIDYKQIIINIKIMLSNALTNKDIIKCQEIELQLENLEKDLKEKLYKYTEKSIIDDISDKSIKIKYNDVITKIASNNINLEKEIESVEEKHKKSKKRLVVSSVDFGALSIASLCYCFASFILPINTLVKKTYSSITNEHTIEELHNQSFDKENYIRLYYETINGYKQVANKKLSVDDIGEAILIAEELLESYKSSHETNQNNESYYEIVFLEVKNPYSALVFYVISSFLLLLTIGKYDKNETNNILLVRIFQNLKNNIIYKKDLKELLEEVKILKNENEEAINELYSLIINSENINNFDLMYEKIEQLKSRFTKSEQRLKL